jgi:hypothetical protein
MSTKHPRLRTARNVLLWSVVIFGVFTIVDFNRLRRSTPDAAVPIAAGIFLDLFGGRRD